MPLHYDKIFYIGEQDIYIPRDEKGKFKSYDSPAKSYTDTIEAMRKLTPTHVVFNGKVGALTGKNALTANVGETVLIVHSQANRDSRPHLIGGHGDYVWETGKFSNPPETGLETWFIRGGSAGAALYTFQQPGIYAYVTHNLIEAVDTRRHRAFQGRGQVERRLDDAGEGAGENHRGNQLTGHRVPARAGTSHPPPRRDGHADRLQTQARARLRRRPRRSAGGRAAVFRGRFA